MDQRDPNGTMPIEEYNNQFQAFLAGCYSATPKKPVDKIEQQN